MLSIAAAPCALAWQRPLCDVASLQEVSSCCWEIGLCAAATFGRLPQNKWLAVDAPFPTLLCISEMRCLCCCLARTSSSSSTPKEQQQGWQVRVSSVEVAEPVACFAA